MGTYGNYGKITSNLQGKNKPVGLVVSKALAKEGSSETKETRTYIKISRLRK